MSFQYSVDFKPAPERSIDVDALRNRIAQRRLELESAAPPAPQCPPSPAAVTRSPAEVEPQTRRTTYEIGHFVQYDGRAFVENVYRLVLGREPDPAGMMGYLQRLESGDHKTLILGDIRYSPEGRACNVQIRNLRSRYAFHALSRSRFLGKLVYILFHLVRLPQLTRALRAQQARLIDAELRLAALSRQLPALEARVGDAHANIVHIKNRVEQNITRLDVDPNDR
ncbi:MAG: DUF4214 domain-containing protein [Bacteroidota bacterium]